MNVAEVIFLWNSYDIEGWESSFIEGAWPLGFWRITNIKMLSNDSHVITVAIPGKPHVHRLFQYESQYRSARKMQLQLGPRVGRAYPWRKAIYPNLKGTPQQARYLHYTSLRRRSKPCNQGIDGFALIGDMDIGPCISFCIPI